ncbi:MAG TPA: GntR family transcriptional regulator [Gemmatimonadaceae bacterium]
MPGLTATRRARASAPAPTSTRPRYQQIADELMRAIGDGTYPVGTLLPTEFELCAQHRISRSTVREALRRLRDAGVIRRRRRIGTEVVARTAPANYRQPTNSIGDLLQYADEARLAILSTEIVTSDASLADLLECRPGRNWLRIKSLRVLPGDPRPVCITMAYLDGRLPRIEREVQQVTGAISAMVERVYGVCIARIEQSFQAVRLTKRQAKLLQVDPSTPGLRAIRRYYREDGTLLELSSAIHPGDRFTYVTTLIRE